MGASLLSRVTSSPSLHSGPTPLQSQTDQLVGGFLEQATDWKALAAMTAGGLAYRTARIGVLGLGTGNAVRAASIGLGLSAEVSTFEWVHRGLHPENPTLWRWSGSGGIRQGLLQSFITFGTLKGAGRLTRAENIILQHLAQDTAMVAGHQISGALNIAPRPEGSLAEQFLHAEATTLQIGAGMALAHRFTPGVHSVERGLDLMTPSPLSLSLDLPRRLEPAWAAAGERPTILQMAASQDPGFKGSWGDRIGGFDGIRERIRRPDPLQESEGAAIALEIVNNKNQPISERYELLLEMAFHEGFKDFDPILNALAKLSEQGAGVADLEPLFKKATETPLLQGSPGGDNKISTNTIHEAFRRKPLTFTLVFRLLMQSGEETSLQDTILGEGFPGISNERANGILLTLSLGALASHPDLKEPRHFHRFLTLLRHSGADSESLGFTLRELVREPRSLDDLSFQYIFELLPFTLNENGSFSFHTQEILDKVLEHPHFNAAEHLENYLSAVQMLTDSANMRATCYAMISAHPRFQGEEAYRILLTAIFQEKASVDVALKAASLVFSRPTFGGLSTALEIIHRSKARSLTKLQAFKELASNPNVNEAFLLKIVDDVRDHAEHPEAKVEVLKHILDGRFIYDHAILEEMAEEFLSFVVRPRRQEPTHAEMAKDLERVAPSLEKIVANPVLPPDSFEQIKALIERFPNLTFIDRKLVIARLQMAFEPAHKYSN